MKSNATWIEPFTFSDKYRVELINLFKKWKKSNEGADSYIKELEKAVSRYKAYSQFNEAVASAEDYKRAIKDLSGALKTLSDLAKNTDRNILNFVRDEFLIQYKHNPIILSLLSSDKWVEEAIGLKISCDNALSKIEKQDGRPPYQSEKHLVESCLNTLEEFGIKAAVSSSEGSILPTLLKIIVGALEIRQDENKIRKAKNLKGYDPELQVARAIINSYIESNIKLTS